ncbi:MAG TPA: hypothetical protein VMZ28_27180 [Kofleriaceae bacterium]|nr:hypothetical protein [Kofleriaceae bacterium]
MQPPREGAERIRLESRRGFEPIDLASSPSAHASPSADVFTQRVFLASPRGRYLAYADFHTGELRVLEHRGVRQRPLQRTITAVRGRDARFSADERLLATLRDSDTHANGTDLVLMDLATGETRVLAAGLDHPGWIEWVASGVVVSHLDAADTALTYVPLEGAPRRIATAPDLRMRFSAARRGHRVVYLVGRRVHVADARRGEARELGELPEEVVNLEMAPDGSEAALVTASEIHRVDGDRLAFLVGSGAHHTVWYSADSRLLAYASERGVSVIDRGRRSYHIDAALGSPVRGARFRAGGGLVIAAGNQAFVWNPARGTRKVLARAEPGETIDAADVYAGGLVTWRHRR